ncbi:glycosyltransferase [Clostridium sp. E02]|uniref:glycosyltransferase family 4 protein n=1 Tax=Clostridium sp. E02 TaxID=2487134 RepID=UPI000F5336C6|nr:glycosyltransferase [Clostridium sp. E02]
MRIIQIIPTLAYGDAVGNDAMALKCVIQDMGFETEIYAENIVCPEKMPAKLVNQIPALSKDDIAILHLSTGAKINNEFGNLLCRKIVRYHNVTPPEFFEVNDLYIAEVNKWGLRSAAYLADKVDYCLADSEFNRQDLIELGYKCKIDVLPILIPFEDYKKKPDQKIIKKYSKTPVVLFTGRVAPNKKHEDIIQSFCMYKKFYNPKAVLVLVGSYKETDLYYQRLKKYVEELNVEDVIFTGHIHFNEILAYYYIADVFLCQSEHEGFCVPLVEAMFFDNPIVAYKSTAIPFTLDKSGFLMDTKDPLLVAGVLHEIDKSTDMRNQLIKEQRKRLEVFSFERIKYQFEKFINSFIENGTCNEKKNSNY